MKKYKLHYRKLEWEGTLPQILKVIRTDLIPNVRKFNPLQIVITEIKPEEPKPEPRARFERSPLPFTFPPLFGYGGYGRSCPICEKKKKTRPKRRRKRK